ncbi:hypothetical protein DFR52_1096 [Hoeflea marina]|uniref:Uncharacterized protein n=1 Tax=Hoeflea marina TaxID=274592 RepID=A0A317PES2_9HYPH|nr:hypothetical protein [Hoeflea marina]PWV95611.1 hypothetical protein DFR52_1096 [Hoeflea marina]
MNRPTVIQGRFGRRKKGEADQMSAQPRPCRSANEEQSPDCARLDALAAELIRLYGEPPLDGRIQIETCKSARSPKLLIQSSSGVLLTVQINPESGYFIMCECLASDDCVVMTASIDRLIDHIVCQISRRLDDLAPRVLDNAVDVLVGCSVAETEKRLILRTLQFYKGDRRQSAFALDIPMEDLADKLRGYLISVVHLRSMR